MRCEACINAPIEAIPPAPALGRQANHDGGTEGSLTLDNTLNLDLSFETGEIVSPVARIYVKMWSGREGDSFHYLGQDCATASELDWVVNRLIGELENIRKSGHAKFAAANAQSGEHGRNPRKEA